jgi:hypothetical protein
LARINEAERAITVLDEIVAAPETARFQRVRATFSRGAGIPATPGRPKWVRSASSQSSMD